MKKNIFMNSMAAALLTGVVAMSSLTSCSSDDNTVETKPETKPGAFTYRISVPASLNSDETRAVTFDAGGSSSSTFFESGDKVYVYKGTSSNFEWSTSDPLTVTPESTAKTASLDGEVTFETTPAVGDEIHLIYNPNAFDGTPNNLFNYADQDGSAASASDHDFAEAVMVITAISNGEITLAQKDNTANEEASFNSLQSMFRQRLMFQTVNGNDIASMPNIVSLTIDCGNKLCTTVRPGGSVGNKLTITNPQITSAGDIYLALHFVSSATDEFVLTATDANGNVYVCSKNAPETGFVNYKYYHGTAVMQAQLYTGAISGEFTVNSSGKKVYFSEGNLQATTINNGTNWSWHFGPTQYARVGNGVANTTINGNGTVTNDGNEKNIDLFGWSTSATHLGISNSTDNNNYSGNFVDWGSASEVTAGIGKGWRTLTGNEWYYLMVTRDGNRFAKAQINGSRSGFILLPDDWKTTYYALKNINDAAADFSANNISSSDWTSTLEARGAVFLPVTGQRNSGTTINYPDTQLHYWSSTSSGSDKANHMRYINESGNNYGLAANTGAGRSNGFAVRLVRDAN